MIKINDELYTADNFWSDEWVVKWFKKELQDRPDDDDRFVEASISAPAGVTWTAEQAVIAVIARGSWA